MSDNQSLTARSIEQTVELNAVPEQAFQALITPSAICQWWQANRAIVLAQPGGLWMAAWGEDVDRPDYVCGYTISQFVPAARLEFRNPVYYSKHGPLPFEAEFVVNFEIKKTNQGCALTVRQTGFPVSSEADEFYAGCVAGWQNTLKNLRDYLSND